MTIEQNVSLKNYNTFGIESTAEYFVSVTSVAELKEVLPTNEKELFILGGGSNMLLTKDIKGLVLHLNLKGIEVQKQNNDHVEITCMAGENWHEFVLYCIDKNYGGLENLSLIPGNVGTSPIQNIGAYGVELKDTFVRCNAVEIATGKEHTFTNAACDFGYRTSIFKTSEKGKFIITSVTFSLTTKNHDHSVSYGAIKDELAKQHISAATIKDISNAVIAIRKSKLPDPAELGNSGSFFKNPVVDAETFRNFKIKFPEAPYYEVTNTTFKIPAGWLIEQAGFKGKRFGDAGVHKNQALVLVNYGNATGKEIWDVAMKIQKKVRKDFGIFIEPEVNIF
ncbi:MAG: UDP-N-acetylmuramate dehydrogenase [Patiriisocius sp.]|uniref:UDP-N-acetylmuramate dehydrogenase n=1 Tax=Patiriisocius sp. TaxID=2822396 RepID=UPI003EF6FD77